MALRPARIYSWRRFGWLTMRLRRVKTRNFSERLRKRSTGGWALTIRWMQPGLRRSSVGLSRRRRNLKMSLMPIGIEMGQFTHVTSYVSKAEQTPEALDPITSAKLRSASGLAHLETKKYKLAARKFLENGPELGSHYNEVIASQDFATYGGLCALATFDRTELKNKVIENVNFRNFLELVPKSES